MGRDSSVKGGILLAAGAWTHRPHRIGRGIVRGKTGHVSLRFIQSNLQRSKLATSELLVEADRRNCGSPSPGTLCWEYWRAATVPGCRVVQRRLRRGPVKAAIIVLDSGVDVEEDQTLIDENVPYRSRKLQDWRCVGVEGHAHRPVPRSRAIRLL
ncbi:hypothetical protein EVAR_90497_1 [Eumeta japonica]|uniref:Uncharacterized protein n=1 Tax=Eumeta variegata TaxID=151549 RepID=A0A4C2A8B3_EUMVA|nr:hypothetical protein EVAR_90497_1 [Eumeta japonica]